MKKFIIKLAAVTGIIVIIAGISALATEFSLVTLAILPHMLDEVNMVSVTPNGGMQILVRDAMYKKPLEEQYDKDYVATWKNYDKSTRPFRFSAELEDMQPVK